jgi:AraC family transcriptional regulator of adaptative response/methylated-DNA-[protein]-cysteine methyltransferase
MKDQKPFSTDEARWDALKNRNSDAEGFFYYGVTSTSVFCRPGCSSRLPLRKNVVFIDSCREALDQGFRPCKRCKPGGKKADAVSVKLIVDACRRIEQAQTPPSLEKLAKRAGLSPSHFHRLFKKIVGVTPKQYGVTHQLQRFHDTILSGSSVTEAIYQSGFSSSSRAYEKSSRLPGIKPGDLKSGWRGNNHTIWDQSLFSWMGYRWSNWQRRLQCRVR